MVSRDDDVLARFGRSHGQTAAAPGERSIRGGAPGARLSSKRSGLRGAMISKRVRHGRAKCAGRLRGSAPPLLLRVLAAMITGRSGAMRKYRRHAIAPAIAGGQAGKLERVELERAGDGHALAIAPMSMMRRADSSLCMQKAIDVPEHAAEERAAPGDSGDTSGSRSGR